MNVLILTRDTGIMLPIAVFSPVGLTVAIATLNWGLNR